MIELDLLGDKKKNDNSDDEARKRFTKTSRCVIFVGDGNRTVTITYP